MAARQKFCSEKVAILNKMTAAKRWLFWKRNLLKKSSSSEEIASPKIKLSWKSRYICEKGNLSLKKKSQIKLVITFNWNYIFGEMTSLWSVFIANLTWVFINIAETDRRRNNQFMFVSYYLHRFLKFNVC